MSMPTTTNNEKPAAYIFGAGTAGMHALANLRADFDIIGFIDNDRAKHGSMWQELPVFTPEIIVTHPVHHVFIASEYFEQIQQQLCSQLNLESSVFRPLPARLLASERFEHNPESIGLSLDLLAVCCRFLAEHNVKHHIDAGTLLGLYRDKSLIPWDDDMDIAVDSSGVNTVVQKVDQIRTALEEVSQQSWQSRIHFTQQSFGAVPANAIRSIKFSCLSSAKLPDIDFFIKYASEEYSDYCLASRGIRMPVQYSQSTLQYVCGEREWPVPAMVEEYLTHHYGDWQTPNPNWSLQDLDNTEVFEA